jgi:lipoprotein-anchoring transpeptidase ErfK/SrfK
MDSRRAVRALLVLLAVPLAGCALARKVGVPLYDSPAFDEESFARKPLTTYRLATPAKNKPPADALIGEMRAYRIRKGDTLLDVARWYDLGYNEIVEANPGVDPFVPPVDSEVSVPTQWLLPCCTWRGIVVNIPEMRLYHFRPAPEDPETTLVDTYPVGLGREGWRTPRGKFTVKTKTVNPRWNIPAIGASSRAVPPTTRSASIASSSASRSTASTAPTCRGASACR